MDKAAATSASACAANRGVALAALVEIASIVSVFAGLRTTSIFERERKREKRRDGERELKIETLRSQTENVLLFFLLNTLFSLKK